MTLSVLALLPFASAAVSTRSYTASPPASSGASKSGGATKAIRPVAASIVKRAASVPESDQVGASPASVIAVAA
jgi:hypothetical protein